MNIKIDDVIGPWKVISVYRLEYDSCLAIVVREGDATEWFMKISKNNNEIKNIQTYDIHKHIYGMKLPDTDAFGTHGKAHWYVMEKFATDCSKGKEYVIDVNLFITSIIQFLKYIHRTHNVIHGDLKINNVLQKDNKYRVCDFETMTKPHNSDICNEINYDNYYYYSYGAEYNMPVSSYKYDLQAVGYMLMIIENKFELLKFQTLAHCFYRNRFRSNYFDQVKKLRDGAAHSMTEKTKAYFKILEAIDWFSLEPPSESVYDEILALYSTVPKDITNS